MVRKFECNDCKCRFEADDVKEVFCPKCHSENVEYANFHVPRKLLISLCSFLAILVLVIITYKIDWKQTEKQGESLIEEIDSLAYGQAETYVNETGLSIPPKINVGHLTFEEKGYRFEVTVDNPPAIKFYYAIVDSYNNKIVAKSVDGTFRDIPFSNADGGVYEVSLFDASADTLICKIEKTGFIKQQAVTRKMTVGELQSKIDIRDSSLMGVGENDYLNPDYELKLVGLPSDAVNIPTTLGEVFDKLDNEIWESVKVNSLGYDDMNRISKIVLSVKEL